MLNLTSEDVIISVDKQTDNKVQKAIKEEFRRATLFVIAHRLNMILDGDWVVVLKRES
jgi:ABC-type multidrug transport system fused ATPase/permease subunit